MTAEKSKEKLQTQSYPTKFIGNMFFFKKKVTKANFDLIIKVQFFSPDPFKSCYFRCYSPQCKYYLDRQKIHQISSVLVSYCINDYWD